MTSVPDERSFDTSVRCDVTPVVPREPVFLLRIQSLRRHSRQLCCLHAAAPRLLRRTEIDFACNWRTARDSKSYIDTDEFKCQSRTLELNISPLPYKP